MIIRFLAIRFYNAGRIIGHLKAKFVLGYNQYNNWENPGMWGD